MKRLLAVVIAVQVIMLALWWTEVLHWELFLILFPTWLFFVAVPIFALAILIGFLFLIFHER